MERRRGRGGRGVLVLRDLESKMMKKKYKLTSMHSWF